METGASEGPEQVAPVLNAFLRLDVLGNIMKALKFACVPASLARIG